MQFKFAKTCSICDLTPSSESELPITLSTQDQRNLSEIHTVVRINRCEYAPIAFGALSVSIYLRLLTDSPLNPCDNTYYMCPVRNKLPFF